MLLSQTGHEILLENGEAIYITDRMTLNYLDKELNIVSTRDIKDEQALQLSYRSAQMSVYKDGKFYITGNSATNIARFLTVDVNTGEVSLMDQEINALVNTIRLTQIKDGMVCNVNGYNVSP